MTQAKFRLPRLRLVWSDEETQALPHHEGNADIPETVTTTNESSPKSSNTKTKKKPQAAERQRRPVWMRLLSLRIGELFNLIVWCVLAGIFMRFTGLGPFMQQQTGIERANDMWGQFLSGLSTAVSLGWKPALTGASIILPIWLCWRFLTLPFRR